MFFILTWSIWKERNARIFSNKQSSIIEIRDLAILILGWWIKGWNDPFSYNASDIVRNPTCLKWLALAAKAPPSTSHSIAPPILWQAPPLDWIKWNVDASFDEKLDHDVVGGVLRNDKGLFMALFSSPIPKMEINSAEIFAILRAIKISLGH